MARDGASLVDRLIQEEFGGKEPSWKNGKWLGINVPIAQNDGAYFIHKGDMIYVQPKSVGGKNNPYCYGCNSRIKSKKVAMSVHFKEWVDIGVPAGEGEVRWINIPYCPNCEEAPADAGVIVE